MSVDSNSSKIVLPEMMTECPICLEALFDEKGIATKGVATIRCHHLTHSDCLAGLALNSDGSRYKIGDSDPPGCPVCGQHASMWGVITEAAVLPAFWIRRIYNCLGVLGPGKGPVPVGLIQEMLKKSPELTESQKKYLARSNDFWAEDRGFQGALEVGNIRYEIVEERGIGYETRTRHMKNNAWDWDTAKGTLWLYRWGEPPNGPRQYPAKYYKEWMEVN